MHSKQVRTLAEKATLEPDERFNALVAGGAGWLAQLGWLVVLAAIIGGQELLETSIMSAALRDEERRRARPAG